MGELVSLQGKSIQLCIICIRLSLGICERLVLGLPTPLNNKIHGAQTPVASYLIMTVYSLLFIKRTAM